MSQLTKQDILEQLSHVKDTQQKQDIVTLGRVSSIIIKNGNVGFALECNASEQDRYESIRQECESALYQLKGVDKVTIVLTSHNETAHVSSAREKSAKDIMPVRYVKHIIAVGSGKGGVGKSTVAAYIALGLKQQGLRVGLVDADIYGPSVPQLLGVKQEPEISEGKQMLPITSMGIATMSMGYLLPDESATIWRGSMATKALHQLIRGTEWGTEEQPLDVLVVDLPPGTGDIHLTFCQQYPVDGAVIVTTPHALSLLDVQKAITMFRKVHIPLLGVVENMSYFQDPISQERHYIFGESTLESFCEQFSVDILDRLPLNPLITQLDDTYAAMVDGAIRCILKNGKNKE